MPAGRITVEGVRELRTALRRATGDLADLKEANLTGAQIVASDARTKVPKLTGRLASTIRPSGTTRAGIVRAGFASVPYAGPIHFGWRLHNIDPRPFLYDAADARVDEVVDRYAQSIEKVLDRIVAESRVT